MTTTATIIVCIALMGIQIMSLHLFEGYRAQERERYLRRQPATIEGPSRQYPMANSDGFQR